eukprot:CAMPEP_0194488580 /NCGR_PEP_ID=MMETSP0253-20130528/8453_1 /TAXON_ID=2966 /ORGANISM="Noctiluca scintillans" /LENGTH=86 /DNA_ID=CAMNT_0039328967 /DNA_START=39 /DNA_END=299 /DNA_ORIENTATION=+
MPRKSSELQTRIRSEDVATLEGVPDELQGDPWLHCEDIIEEDMKSWFKQATDVQENLNISCWYWEATNVFALTPSVSDGEPQGNTK